MTKWHQDTPFDDYTPNCWDIAFDTRHAPAGCAPIAAAQIMAYHKHPKVLPNVSGLMYYGQATYIEELSTKKYNSYITTPSHRQGAAKLSRALGDLMDVTYTYWATGMTSLRNNGNKVITTFRTMGYTVPESFYAFTYSNFWKLKASLDANKPVFIYGFTNSAETNGHVWVIDGYKETKNSSVQKSYYFDENGTFNYKGDAIYSAKHIRMVHCNFGWGDTHEKDACNHSDGHTCDDGWYNSYVFETSVNSYKYDINFLPGITKP